MRPSGTRVSLVEAHPKHHEGVIMGKSDDMGGKAKPERDQARKTAKEPGRQAAQQPGQQPGRQAGQQPGRQTGEAMREQQSQRARKAGKPGEKQREDLRDSVPDELNDASHTERESWDT
jgi:hypothetical protein